MGGVRGTGVGWAMGERERERERERQTDRQRDRHADRHADKQTHNRVTMREKEAVSLKRKNFSYFSSLLAEASS